MPKTKISYCDYTWNASVGCPLPICSTGCEHCHARKAHNMRHRAYLAGKKLPKMYAKPFETIQYFPERLDEPLHIKKPSTIFVGSQTDLFCDTVPVEFITKVMARIEDCPQHTFLILTKRIKNAFNVFDTFEMPLPDNAWMGATICNQPEADKIIPPLLQIPAKHRWLLIEPLLGDIKLGGFDGKTYRPWLDSVAWPVGIDWVVIGCESLGRRYGRLLQDEESPEGETWFNWIKVAINIVNQCKSAGVKVFVKQIPLNGKVEHRIEKFPESLKVRELPF